jgi:hypothetical protein
MPHSCFTGLVLCPYTAQAPPSLDAGLVVTGAARLRCRVLRCRAGGVYPSPALKGRGSRRFSLGSRTCARPESVLDYVYNLTGMTMLVI